MGFAYKLFHFDVHGLGPDLMFSDAIPGLPHRDMLCCFTKFALSKFRVLMKLVFFSLKY